MLPIETPDGQEYFDILLYPHGVDTVARTWKAWGKGILTPVSHLILRFWAQTWAEMPTWPAQRCEMSDQESCGTSSQHPRIQSQSTCSAWAKGIHNCISEFSHYTFWQTTPSLKRKEQQANSVSSPWQLKTVEAWKLLGNNNYLVDFSYCITESQARE